MAAGISAARAADWPGLAEALANRMYDLTLRAASGKPAGLELST
jgi:hypothetical protein